MHPLMLRIIAGEDISMCEISEWNAQWIMNWARKGSHDAKMCWSKDCVHGARAIDIEYAARLASHEFCCGGVG